MYSLQRLALAGLLSIAALTAPGSVSGQEPYVLHISSTTASSGAPAEVGVTLDNAGLEIQGWSFGVCHDESVLDLVSATDGATTLTVKDGSPPDFRQINEEPGGVTMGVVICFTACATLATGTDLALLDLSYAALAPAGTTTTVSFCSDLGVPPINTVIVVNGASSVPVQNSGTIEITSPNHLRIADAFTPAGSEIDVPVRLTNVVPVDGVQLGFTFDPTLLSALSAETIGPASSAAFFSLQAGLAPGEVGLGLVMDLSPPLALQIPVGNEVPIVQVRFAVDAAAPAGTVFPLLFAETVGDPPLVTTLVTAQAQELPNLHDGSIEVADYRPFVRGDCNRDLLVNLADGIMALNHLFVGTLVPPCLDACDANDDNLINAADPVFVFAYQFSEGPPPVAPFPNEGIDPTPGDGIGCDGDIDDQ